MTDNNNTKDDRNKLSAVWNAEPNGIGLDDRITIIENWSYEALKYLPPWIMPEAIESDGYYFVAHSRMDFKIVYTDILRLESVGVDIWYDRAMEPGRNWQEIAERMMNRQECKGVIVYGTVNSMASEPVQTELLVADELGKNIIFINHGEDSGATAAKNLYEKAQKSFGEDCACVEGFEELLTRIGNADITYIDLAHSAARKKEQLDKIKSEEVLIYESMFKSASVVGVKYLGVKSVKIPKKVTIDGNECKVAAIEACAFANCRALERVEFPETLEWIGEHAFFGCASLTKVHLGRNVRYVAENAFEQCAKLEEVSVAGGNKHIIVKDRIYYGPQPHRDGYGIIFVPRDLEGGITLLDGLKQINEHAFGKRRGITSVTIPDSVTSIRGYAFYKCDSLTSVTIPNSVTSIGDSAFEGCTSLTSLTIGDGVTSIGEDAFWGCTSLTSVTIPDSVTSIGSSAFLYCRNLTSVTIGNGVTSIGRYAFQKCTSLTSITIPNSVTNIGGYAFYGCDSLTSVTIGNGVTSIGEDAFWGCNSLTSVTIPDSVTSIGDSAFEGCTSLTSVTIGDGVTSIGEDAFWGCNSLTSVTIPDSVTSIGDWAFRDCTSLASVTIPDSVTSMGSCAFCGCTSLTSITIPDSVTSIGDYAFSGCTSLTSITIPDGVASIGENAFRFCWSLRHVTYSGTVRQWKKLTAKCQGWAGYCPCEVVKCKDDEVPVVEHDRKISYDYKFEIDESDEDEEE